MKCMLCKLVPALLLLSLCSSSAQTKIGTVNLTKVFDDYYKTKQANAVIKDRVADLEKDFKQIVAEYDKIKEEHTKALADANNQALASDERDKRKKLAEDKLKDLKAKEDEITDYRKRSSATLEGQKQRMRDNILNEIKVVLNAKAKSSAYSLVLDTSAKSANNTLELIQLVANRQDPAEESSKSTTVVLYANPENDLTSDVIKELNLGAPPDTTSVNDKKEEKKKEGKNK
jgi:outer membrane protein